ncbi:uncharacterized protein LOC117644134 [Thrips palmi]|uniref:Uncharacterized protein LOC117644134 n=1 Tax=Thrips palmi TaxID=161013 RepID=A0A6P8YPT4_THRPL|nr:uncharacterized protein LOC117644134 [Thrips palmi]
MACLVSRITCASRAGRCCLFKSASSLSFKLLLDLRHHSNYTEETALRLQELGVSPNDIIKNPHVSILPFNYIEHRLNFCAEGGLKTSLTTVTNFDLIVKTTIPVLKEAEILSSDVNVIDTLMASINFDGPYPSHVDPDGTYQLVHFQTLSHCMQSSFGYAFPPWHRYRHACLKFALRNIELFKSLGLGWRWIRNHPSLLCFANPYNLKQLCDFEKMYDLPVSLTHLLRKDPNVAFVDHEDYKAIFFILMNRQVCKHDIINTKETGHFLVDPDVLEATFQKVLVPSTSLDINILSLLYKSKYLKDSSKDKSWNYLQHLIKKRKNPFIKVSTETVEPWRQEMKQWFLNKKIQLEYKPCRHDPYVTSNDVDEEDDDEEDIKKEESLRGRKRGRLASFVAISLDLEQDFAESELNRVPWGSKESTIRASRTLKFLQDSGFTVEEIRQVIQLLIYPRNDVQKALRHVLSDKKYGSSKYRSRHLHLCLYHILMKYNYRIYQPSSTS